MGVRTNDIGLVPTQSATGFPAAGEWAFGNGGEDPIVFPLGNNGDRVGVWANAATHVRPDEDPTKLQKILFGEDEAVQFNTVLIPARCWAEWTFSEFANAWLPTSASFETPIPPPGGLPDGGSGDPINGDGWMITNAFIIVPAEATEIVLPSAGAELVPLVSGDMCGFYSVKEEQTLVRSMVPALAHDHTALQDPISRHYPGRTYYTWIYMAGLWVPQAAAVGMAAPWAVWAALAAAPEHVLFNNKRLRLVAPPVDPTDGATKSYVDSRPGGTGDVVGPAAATDGRVAVHSGTTGKLLKDGTKLEADLVVGPAGATDGRVVVMDGITGKLLKNGLKQEADLVTGPVTATADRVASFNGGTGKIIKDSGVAAGLLVTSAGAGTVGDVAYYAASRQLASVGLAASRLESTRIFANNAANFTAAIYTVHLVDTSAGPVTATLPPVSGNSYKNIVIKRIGTNDVIIDGAGAETIDGQATLTLTQNYEAAELVCTGTQWYRI